ncbi:MAG: hypothetical protein QME45_13535, partial [Clostridiales bacterium]|nr:hypothetical protein [Clostridiales bacterium]
HQCTEFLHNPMHGIPGSHIYEARNKCHEGFHYTTSEPDKRKGSFLLLSAGERCLRHTHPC